MHPWSQDQFIEDSTEFRIGQTVRLKSGSFPMTVEKIEKLRGIAHVVWWDSTLKRAKFPKEVLQNREEPKFKGFKE